MFKNISIFLVIVAGLTSASSVVYANSFLFYSCCDYSSFIKRIELQYEPAIVTDMQEIIQDNMISESRSLLSDESEITYIEPEMIQSCSDFSCDPDIINETQQNEQPVEASDPFTDVVDNPNQEYTWQDEYNISPANEPVLAEIAKNADNEDYQN